MAEISQTVRYASRGPPENPSAILKELKPTRLITGSGVPSPAIGEDLHQYLDEDSGILYLRNGDTWSPLVNYVDVISPNLPPATVPDNLTVDSVANKNTNDLAINAVAALSLSGGSLDVDATGNILIDSVTDTTITSATGTIELQGQTLSLIASGGAPSVINTGSGGMLAIGKNGATIDMTSNNVNIGSAPTGMINFKPSTNCDFDNKPVTSISAINGSDLIATYKTLGVNLSSQLEYLEPCDSIQGVIPNINTTLNNQYWEVGVATSPADFFTITLPNPAGQNRRLVGLAAHFLHQNPTWQILSGNVNIVVGYIPVGQAPVVGNLVTLWTSPNFAIGVPYPTINDPQITTPATLPIGAAIVVYVAKGPGVNASNNQADISLCLKFL